MRTGMWREAERRGVLRAAGLTPPSPDTLSTRPRLSRNRCGWGFIIPTLRKNMQSQDVGRLASYFISGFSFVDILFGTNIFSTLYLKIIGTIFHSWLSIGSVHFLMTRVWVYVCFCVTVMPFGSCCFFTEIFDKGALAVSEAIQKLEAFALSQLW